MVVSFEESVKKLCNYYSQLIEEKRPEKCPYCGSSKIDINAVARLVDTNYSDYYSIYEYVFVCECKTCGEKFEILNSRLERLAMFDV